MKFIIEREILLTNLLYVSKAISTKNLIPILAGIKFELNKEGLYLSASDNDISIQSLILKKDIKDIKNDGSIVIQGKYIVEIIRKLPEGVITIEVIDGLRMVISTSSSEFNLNGISANEFPNLYLEETKEPIKISTALLKTVISQTFFATSSNESRPLLTGINFRSVKNMLEIIATDSYRLSKKNILLEDNINNEFNIVIPSRNLLELSRIMEENDNVDIHIFNNKVLFKYKNILFQSRLLSGTYPASASIIPTDFSFNIDCEVMSLYNMIDRASLLTSDKDKNTIKMSLSKNQLLISSNSPEIGKVEEKMEITNNKDFSISYSSKFMMDALKSFNTKSVTLNMINDNSPIVIKSQEDDSLIQLILPIKTY